MESTQKVMQGLFSSFWSYELPFRQEVGEGEAVMDGQTEFPLLDSDQLCPNWPIFGRKKTLDLSKFTVLF